MIANYYYICNILFHFHILSPYLIMCLRRDGMVLMRIFRNQGECNSVDQSNFKTLIETGDMLTNQILKTLIETGGMLTNQILNARDRRGTFTLTQQYILKPLALERKFYW